MAGYYYRQLDREKRAVYDAMRTGICLLYTSQCVNYGQRVQNSVFECLLDTAQCRSLQNTLCKIMDPSGIVCDFTI